MAQQIEFKNSFLDASTILLEARDLYIQRDFEKVLYFLDKHLTVIEMNSTILLSEYYDLVAAVLWKIGQKSAALDLWNKSYTFNLNNRHAFLCISYFSKGNNMGPFSLFLSMKRYEFRLLLQSGGMLFDGNEERAMRYIIDFWNTYLQHNEFETYTRIDLEALFTGLDIFDELD